MDSRILILGFTFKENCPDVRNTRVIDIVKRLEEYHAKVCIYDPWADAEKVKQEYQINCQVLKIEEQQFDAVILAVSHDFFKELDIRKLSRNPGVIYDVKAALDKNFIDGRL